MIAEPRASIVSPISHPAMEVESPFPWHEGSCRKGSLGPAVTLPCRVESGPWGGVAGERGGGGTKEGNGEVGNSMIMMGFTTRGRETGDGKNESGGLYIPALCRLESSSSASGESWAGTWTPNFT
jgi:hypothetical protein